jgi:integrase
MKITENSLLKMQPGDSGEKYFRDDKLTGYAVRVRRMADGKLKRTFAVMYQERRDGKRKTVKAFIGDHGDPWTEAAARKEAARILALKETGQPVVSLKQAAKSDRTVDALIDAFNAEHVPDLKPKSQVDYRWCLEKMIRPGFTGRRVSALTRLEIKAWHRKEAHRPYAANKSLQVLSRMLAHAVEKGWLEANPGLGIKPFEEKPREVWLNAEEMPRFVAELNSRQSPHAEILRFLTVTGWRIGEALSLRFDMVDLQNLVAHLPDTKTGRQSRALSTDAAILLDRQDHKLGFVFSGNGGRSGLGYKQVRELLKDVCQAAGVTVITPHGLRHSAATHAALAGASLFELKEGFGWKSHQMAGRYVAKAENLGRAGMSKVAGAVNIFERPAAKIAEVKK